MSDAVQATDQLSPGRALAAARAELKLSVADVSQQIKYGVKQINAIEADDYAKLPGTTFVRGMIRSYAKLVQINPEPLLAELGRRDIPATPSVDLRTTGQEPFVEGSAKPNRIYVLLSLAALVTLAAVAYEWRVHPPDTGEVVTITPKSTPADAGAAGTAAAPVAAPVAAPAAAPAPPASVPVAQPAEVAVSALAANEKTAASGAKPKPDAPAAQPASPAAGLKRIELEFDQLSWVEIKQANGKILMSQLNQPGSRQQIDGKPPFDVVIGNAASVHLKYDGEQVDLRPFFKIDVARLKLE